MLSGGMVGRFFNPNQGNLTKVLKHRLAPLGTGLIFFTFTVLLADGLTVSHFYGGLDFPSTKGHFFL